MPSNLAALPYHGGKSFVGPRNIGRWILNQLPADTKVLYCEPFAGMLGVLLNRSPASQEVVNDSSEFIVDWWTAVRDHPAELASVLRRTPKSRVEFRRCGKTLREGHPDIVERARCVTVRIAQSVEHGIAGSYWAPRLHNLSRGAAGMSRFNIHALAERIRNVQLECRDAVEFLERMERVEGVIYCDPPYRNTKSDPYGACELDRSRLQATLLRQKGRVAISGAEGEWDSLGWRKTTMETTTSQMHKPGTPRHRRTECLWMNYDEPLRNLTLFG